MKKFQAIVLSAGLSLSLASPVSADAAGAPSTGSASAFRVADAPVPRLAWRECRRAKRFECTKARVPLDYDDPGGATIRLALTRLPASEPARRIGSVFLNPGGPGGSGVGFVHGLGRFLFSNEVRARFDIVGFDPRGIAGSTPLECFTSPNDAFGTLAPFAFPVTRAEERVWIAADRAYAAACARRGGPIIDHMSTANVARDMDLLRQAVGDEMMSFVGYSYGSYVGATYANMFPDRVRAVVIDGVIDPISYATGRGDEAERLPSDARLKSEQGAYDALLAFFSACDAGAENCAFSDGRPKRRYARLARHVRHQPLQLPDGEGGTFRFTYADLVLTTLFSMYDPSSWPDLAAFLQELRTFAQPRRTAAALQALRARLGLDRGQEYQQVLEGFAGVWCSDADNPDRASAWAEAARAADHENPYFGRPWVWSGSICAAWPGHDGDRYTGPFDQETANTVLVIGNRNDPATRYQDAVSTTNILSDARLLTLDASGHTSLFISRCVDRAVDRYLLTGDVPPAGTVCQEDVVPFSEPAPRPRSFEVSAAPYLLPATLRR